MRRWLLTATAMVGLAPVAQAQTSCSQLPQAQLLSSFSDKAGPGGIKPKNLRDFVCSTITNTPGGVPPSLPLPLPSWTNAGRPVPTFAGLLGFNTDSSTLDLWNGSAWQNPSAFIGGSVP